MTPNTKSSRKNGPDHQTDEAKAAASERMKRVWANGRDGVLREDLQLLAQMGGFAITFEYAERAGCTPYVAAKRLKALVAAGLAEGRKRAGYGNTVFYTATPCR
jgi:hypothetical protein